MLFTKELAAKGTAMLGSASAGGTGLYYGGNYLANLPGSQLERKVQEKRGNHISWEVTKPNNNSTWLELDKDNNPVNFANKDSFEVKVVSKSVDNAEQINHGTSNTTDAAINLSCNFKFEVVGSRNNIKDIKEEHKKKIFWEADDRSKQGLFGLLEQSMNAYADPQDGSTDWKTSEIIEVKNKFFQLCKQHNTSTTKVDPISIKFKVENSFLVPSEMDIFNKWFFLTKEQANKKIHLNTRA